MEGGDALTEGQPQAGAALAAGTGAVGHIEGLGHVGQILFRDAAAAVRHDECPRPGREADGITGMGGAAGVLHQVCEQAFQEDGVPLKRDRLRTVQKKADAPFLQQRGAVQANRPEQGLCRDLLEGDGVPL